MIRRILSCVAPVVMALSVMMPGLMTPGSAWAGDYVFTPRAQAGQAIETRAGDTVIVSQQAGSEVDLYYYGAAAGKRVLFQMTVTNNSPDAVKIDVPDVSVRYDDDRLRIYTAAELIRKLNGRYVWASLGQALVAGMDQGTATRAVTTTSEVRVDHKTYEVKTTTYETDPDRLAAAKARAQAADDLLNASYAETLGEINRMALQPTTLWPRQPYTARICVDRPWNLSDAPLVITVRVGQEVHSFTFDVTKG